MHSRGGILKASGLEDAAEAERVREEVEGEPGAEELEGRSDDGLGEGEGTLRLFGGNARRDCMR